MGRSFLPARIDNIFADQEYCLMIVDAHEDIAWNVLTFGRDYMRGVHHIREREQATVIPSQNGNTLLGIDAWHDGDVAIIFSTLFVSPARMTLGLWETQTYTDQRQAHECALRQLDVYRKLVDEHPFMLVETRADLERCLTLRDTASSPEEKPIGLVLLMEGADPILEPAQIDDWFAQGLRVVGPAWESTRYTGGTHEPGPLTRDGRELLERMQQLRMILDLSHMSEEAYLQAIDRYEGVMIASHANPRRFLPTSRGLSDRMIMLLAERGGVVGVVPYNLFLSPEWRRGDPKELMTLRHVTEVIDHICQLTGSVDHVAIGSDFDGGFGLEHVPAEIDTLADLNKLTPVLAERGYQPGHIASILAGNWLRVLRAGLPL
jgi:membrane dipeptidase